MKVGTSGDVRGGRYHFVGLGGSGMSALAQFVAQGGGAATGSDRDFDHGRRADIRGRLEEMGITVYPQDGTGVSDGCDAVVVSTAIETDIPDVAAANRTGVPVVHRSELLAALVAGRRSIAVTGTSGKSTVTAMIFTALEKAGLDPSVITGGPLTGLSERGLLGNAWAGAGEHLVFEADESDGSLVRYQPWCSVVLNLQRDHKEPAEVAQMFRTLRSRTRGPFLAGEDPALDEVAAGAERFALAKADGGRAGLDAAILAEAVVLERDGSRFRIDGVDFRLPAPGIHNVRNALAATAACRRLGLETGTIASALAQYAGVDRRFQTVGVARGVTVIDDFAHNPDKIAASLAAARSRGGRVLAVFQPHGFGPTRFLKDGLIESLASGLGPDGIVWLPEIYFAGGTVKRDISSRDIVAGINSRGVRAGFVERREELEALVPAECREGDTVLVMGARDPSLTGFCRRLLDEIAAAG